MQRSRTILILAVCILIGVVSGCGKQAGQPQPPAGATAAPPQRSPAQSAVPATAVGAPVRQTPEAAEEAVGQPEPDETAPKPDEEVFNEDLSQKPLGELIDLLPESRAKRRAAEKEILARAPAVVPQLFDFMQDKRFMVRWMIANMFGQLRDPQTIAPLLRTLVEDHESHVRWRSIWAVNMVMHEHKDLADQTRQKLIQKIKELEEQLPTLQGEQADEAAEYRRRAAVALSQFDGPEAVPVLHEWLRPEAPKSARWESVFCLASIYDETTADLLIPLLKDEQVDVAKQSALSLGSIGNPKAIAALAEALGNAPDEVRWRAASALGSIGGPEATKALQQALQAERAKPEPNKQVLKTLEGALERVSKR